MKVRVNEEIVVDVKVSQTASTPSGNGYFSVDYLVDGICIHRAFSGCVSGAPNPIAALDSCFEVTEYHYQDIPDPDPKPESIPVSVGKLYGGTSGERPAWWITRRKTHRQAIIDAFAQIVPEE